MVIGQEDQARVQGCAQLSGDDDNQGVTPVRAGYELDLARLMAWMGEHIDGFAGPIEAAQFRGGQSNPTYKLTTPARSYVLRKKPPGTLLKGAHAVEREAHVLGALQRADFPAPRVLGASEDADIIGTAFYVMEMVEGRVFWDAALGDLAKAARAPIVDAMNATIAHLHSIDIEAVGLGDYGRRGNYFERQVTRWSQQYEADVEAGRNDDLDRLIDWLKRNLPADDDATTIIHGDFRIDNMIFHPTEPKVLAVLDWELSTLGHPGADFAYNAMMYRMPPHIVAGLAGADIEELGFPSEATYVAAYCARTGRTELANYQYYMAFSFFRIAAIFHGIKGRVIRGTAASAQARQRVDVFPELCALAWAQTSNA